MSKLVVLGLAFAGAIGAQQVCAPVATYSPCEIVIELNDQEAAQHPNPYSTVDLRAELRSPKAKTILMPAFWDGGRRLVIRFTPTDAGKWDFRLTGNLERLNGKLGQVEATESQDAGFLQPANVHHWRYTESLKAHLWMGDTRLDFASMPKADFDAYVESRSKQKFNHVRGNLLGSGSFAEKPNPEWFQEVDRRVLALNQKGIFVDLILAPDAGAFAKLFSGWQERERYMRYVASRYSAFHVTWQVMGQFESHPDGRSLLKDAGAVLKKFDPYNHPRSTGTVASSAPALPDGWMNYVVHHASEDTIGAVEHHVFPTPFVNSGFHEGAAGEAFVKRLWNTVMNGQYPTASIRDLDSLETKAMTAWLDFTLRNRFWELEPYYDVDGARAVALPGVEYILYIEQPGTVEILLEKHGYDVFWLNPLTGELTKEKKEFKGEKWVGEPPTKTHPWVLQLSREGRKEGMRSYKFESRPNLMQEIEQNPAKMPFEVIEPSSDRLSISKPPKHAVKIKRETRGTRSMLYLWTGEVPTEGRGYRILGTGADGVLRIPASLAKLFPAVFNIRLYALNAVGKVYAVDRVYRLTE